MIKNINLKTLIQELKAIQEDFYAKFKVSDIISNSKIFEILIANSLCHQLIPGHSGSRDAKDSDNGEYEYKHYKESSSNHSWTFNDYTDNTISKLRQTKAVIFAHIDDSDVLPKFDWYYFVPGNIIADYLEVKTKGIKNTRKMINVSPKQIENQMKIEKSLVTEDCKTGKYYKWLNAIFSIAKKIEKITGTKEVLTSNKFWEILTAMILGHRVLSEQAGHDAVDSKGGFYEYKVSKNHSWNFQDISKAVLEKYKLDKKMMLVVVNKDEFKIKKIYEADPLKTIKTLKRKLREKKRRFKEKDKKLRRLQVSLSSADIKKMKAKLVYNN